MTDRIFLISQEFCHDSVATVFRTFSPLPGKRRQILFAHIMTRHQKSQRVPEVAAEVQGGRACHISVVTMAFEGGWQQFYSPLP